LNDDLQKTSFGEVKEMEMSVFEIKNYLTKNNKFFEDETII
jgi:hypothetical protein